MHSTNICIKHMHTLIPGHSSYIFFSCHHTLFFLRAITHNSRFALSRFVTTRIILVRAILVCAHMRHSNPPLSFYVSVSVFLVALAQRTLHNAVILSFYNILPCEIFLYTLFLCDIFVSSTAPYFCPRHRSIFVHATAQYFC